MRAPKLLVHDRTLAMVAVAGAFASAYWLLRHSKGRR